MLAGNDRETLRDLGREFRDIARDPVNDERKALWTRLNKLERVRPLVFIFEIPWHEMEYENELAPHCCDPFLRELEISMRRTIYQWRHMQGDMVVEAYIPSPLAIADTGTGISEDAFLSITDERSDIVSRHFNIQIKNEEDLGKIKNPVISHDEKKSDENYRLLSEIFDGILPVRKIGVKGTSVAPWDWLVRFTGISEILTDMIARPDYVHKAITRMTETCLSSLEQFHKLNLLSLNNDNTHHGGGLQYTDELPQADCNPERVRPSDMWGRTMSQIFSTVSPSMHEEFALQYELKYLRRFGLTYYGCCEPLHKKIGILRKVPNLRKISMSPWVDVDEAAEAVGRDYVYSLKANPAFLSWKKWEPGVVRKDLEDNLRKTKNCVVEIILKDISTVAYEPQRLWEWAQMAGEAASSA